MSRPRIYTPEEIRERKRLRSVEYRKRNREKIRAYKKRPEVRERRKAERLRWREKNKGYARQYYATHKDAFREYNRAWKARKPDRVKTVSLAYQKAHPEYKRMYRMRCIVREMTDCEYYAERRRKNRERAARRRLRMGLTYVGKPAMRIPDWCVRGGVLDTRSQWLFCNATDEQRAYARELAIERKEWRMNNEWRMAR